jgi:hypothetical protein
MDPVSVDCTLALDVFCAISSQELTAAERSCEKSCGNAEIGFGLVSPQTAGDEIMKIAMTASIVALALSSAWPQGAMAAQRQAGPSVSSSSHQGATVRGSSVGPTGAVGSGLTNPSGNSLINTSPSGSTMFPYGRTNGTAR